MNTTPTTTTTDPYETATTSCDLPDTYNAHGVRFKVTEWTTEYPNGGRGTQVSTEYTPAVVTERTQTNGEINVCAAYVPTIHVTRTLSEFWSKDDPRYGTRDWNVTVRYELGGWGHRSVGIKEKKNLTTREAQLFVNDLMARYHLTDRHAH